MCERTTLAATEQMPCIIVDDGRTPTQEAARQYEADRPAREEAARQYEAAAPARAAQAAREAEADRAAAIVEHHELFLQCMNMNNVGDLEWHTRRMMSAAENAANKARYEAANKQQREMISSTCETYATLHTGLLK